MRKRFVLSVVLLFCVFFSIPAYAADTVKFDLTRIYYDDALRTVDYDFSGEKSNFTDTFNNNNIVIDDSSGSTFVTYKNPVGDYNTNYGLQMTFQHRVFDGNNPDTSMSFLYGDKKAVYEFPKPSFVNVDYSDMEGYPINFSSTQMGNIGNHALAENTWFYSTRVENFRGFSRADSNYYNEFEFSMLPPFGVTGRSVLPAFRVSAKWVSGLYRGKIFDNTLVLSAHAQRYGDEIQGNDPGAHGDLIWESEVGGANPAFEVSTGSITPENTVLDLAVQVTPEAGRSVVKLYYRLFDKSQTGVLPGMEQAVAGWNLFHTIPIPNALLNSETYRFPGLPVTMSSYKVRSRAIAFWPEKYSGIGQITVGEAEAIDKTALGVPGATPISTKERFILENVTPKFTVVICYTLSEAALPLNKSIKVGDIVMKKLLASGSTEFEHSRVSNVNDLTDGKWCLTQNDKATVVPTTMTIHGSDKKNYYVYFAIKDNGRFDLDDREGIIEDPTVLVTMDATSPGGGGGTPSNPTPSTSTTISGFSLTLGGVAYVATEQADGSLLIVVPYGTDLTKLAPTFTLPAGAVCVPASGTPQDFTKPVTYTVTAADGKTKQTYTIVVKVEPAASNIVERELVSPVASLWRAYLTINPDGTVGVRIVAPFTGDVIPDSLYTTLSGLSNLKASVTDADGKTVATYTTRSSNGYFLTIEGTAPSRAAADAVTVKSLQYWLPSDTTEYKQTFGTTGIPVTDMTLAGVTDNSGQEKSGSSGCDVGLGIAAVAMLVVCLWNVKKRTGRRVG